MPTETEQQGSVVAVSRSERKGERKQGLACARLIAGWGLDGDAHAGAWHRQVSLLAIESIDKIRALGLDVGPGDFAENITTDGIDLMRLRIGDHLQVGAGELEITQIGKECHTRCAIFEAVGDCVMPREGVFARVIAGGEVRPGDGVTLIKSALSEPQPTP